ncbi:hypothetical protein G3I24_30705, partial [Micromonospora aurantiaca]|nr:hypothetical protein [Micromonospora aurantiaca]
MPLHRHAWAVPGGPFHPVHGGQHVRHAERGERRVHVLVRGGRTRTGPQR